MGRGLAHTRQADRKAKTKAEWVARTLWGWDGSLVTPGRIGRLASIHCRACKCCGARGARALGGDTMQERRASIDTRQQLAELHAADLWQTSVTFRLSGVGALNRTETTA